MTEDRTSWLYTTGMVFEERVKNAEAAQAATIEVLNDCQAEMGRQCERAHKAEAEVERLTWMLRRAVELYVIPEYAVGEEERNVDLWLDGWASDYEREHGGGKG